MVDVLKRYILTDTSLAACVCMALEKAYTGMSKSRTLSWLLRPTKLIGITS